MSIAFPTTITELFSSSNLKNSPYWLYMYYFKAHFLLKKFYCCLIIAENKKCRLKSAKSYYYAEKLCKQPNGVYYSTKRNRIKSYYERIT